MLALNDPISLLKILLIYGVLWKPKIRSAAVLKFSWWDDDFVNVVLAYFVFVRLAIRLLWSAIWLSSVQVTLTIIKILNQFHLMVFFLGVRTSENNFTSPMLSVHFHLGYTKSSDHGQQTVSDKKTWSKLKNQIYHFVEQVDARRTTHILNSILIKI